MSPIPRPNPTALLLSLVFLVLLIQVYPSTMLAAKNASGWFTPHCNGASFYLFNVNGLPCNQKRNLNMRHYALSWWNYRLQELWEDVNAERCSPTGECGEATHARIWPDKGSPKDKRVLGKYDVDFSAQAGREQSIDKQVAVLIEKMLVAKNEQQAFSDLEALGCAAVPPIIKRMDDRRRLSVPQIALRNISPHAFEGMRHYSPRVVVDALAAILNQITERDFGFIYNGATEVERTKTIQGWRDFLSKTPSTKVCDAR